MKRRLIGAGIFIFILAIVYFTGPVPFSGKLNGTLPIMPENLALLEYQIDSIERANPLIKSDNEARIIWADSAYQKTPYSIVYLHGFGASQAEGAPVHTMLAKKYGCNLYLSRLKEQGIASDSAFKNMTVANLLESAKQAVAVGKALGEKVIVMGTSTGAALGLYIAAENPDIAGLIMYSPLIRDREEQLRLLTMPWGRQLMEWMIGGDHLIEEREEEDRKYWSRVYYIEGYTALSLLVEKTMKPEVFQKVKCPVFLGYYYKNEDEQDGVVSVPAMLEMYDALGTPDSLKVKKAFPNAGNHVIGSYIRSGDWNGVFHETDRFLQNVVHLQPKLVEEKRVVGE